MERRAAAKAAGGSTAAAVAGPSSSNQKRSGYDSDLEREEELRKEAAAEAAAQAGVNGLRDHGEADALQEALRKEAELAAAWEAQNAWMDEYRKPHRDEEEEEEAEGNGGRGRRRGRGRNGRRGRSTSSSSSGSRKSVTAEEGLGTSDGHHQQQQQQQQIQQQVGRKLVTHPGSSSSSKHAVSVMERSGARQGRPLEVSGRASGGAHQHQLLSEAEEMLLQQPFVPLVSDEYPEYAVMSDAYHEGMSEGELDLHASNR